MNETIYNNGNSFMICGDFLMARSSHTMIQYQAIDSVNFEVSSSNGFFSKLLGNEKGTLTIVYKTSFFSNDTNTIRLDIKKDEFVMVNGLVTTINRYIAEGKRKKAAQQQFEAKKAAKCEEFNKTLSSIPNVSIELTDDECHRRVDEICNISVGTSITKKTSPKRYKDFVVIDTETSGLRASSNEIIEISAIKFIDLKPVGIFTTLLKPRKSISAAASKINGITNEMVKECPSFAQIRKSLEAFVGYYPIVAHNAEFDVEFLFASGMNIKEGTLIYDTLSLSRKNIRFSTGDKLSSYKLVDVCEYCNIYFDCAHRSSADAYATGLLFIENIKRVTECGKE